MRVIKIKLPKLLLCSCLCILPAVSFALTEEQLLSLLETQNVEAIQAGGAEVMSTLVKLYQKSDNSRRTKIAAIFYGLSWKSEEAKRVLMSDVKTENESLRLQVQWALGRVSNDDQVVAQLLENMRNDPNPLFRDKAACALANDQIHLTERQKVKLYEGVISALGDDKQDVRRIAGLVMQIQTGQSKNYNPSASPEERVKSIAAWTAWLNQYKLAVRDEK